MQRGIGGGGDGSRWVAAGARRVANGRAKWQIWGKTGVHRRLAAGRAGAEKRVWAGHFGARRGGSAARRRGSRRGAGGRKGARTVAQEGVLGGKRGGLRLAARGSGGRFPSCVRGCCCGQRTAESGRRRLGDARVARGSRARPKRAKTAHLGAQTGAQGREMVAQAGLRAFLGRILGGADGRGRARSWGRVEGGRGGGRAGGKESRIRASAKRGPESGPDAGGGYGQADTRTSLGWAGVGKRVTQRARWSLPDVPWIGKLVSGPGCVPKWGRVTDSPLDGFPGVRDLPSRFNPNPGRTPLGPSLQAKGTRICGRRADYTPRENEPRRGSQARSPCVCASSGPPPVPASRAAGWRPQRHALGRPEQVCPESELSPLFCMSWHPASLDSNTCMARIRNAPRMRPPFARSSFEWYTGANYEEQRAGGPKFHLNLHWRHLRRGPDRA